MLQVFNELIQSSGIANITFGEITMIGIALVFLYLSIKKGYEPYLLIPIAFGMLLVNLPLGGLMSEPTSASDGGLLYYLYQGVEIGRAHV